MLEIEVNNYLRKKNASQKMPIEYSASDYNRLLRSSAPGLI